MTLHVLDDVSHSLQLQLNSSFAKRILTKAALYSQPV